MACQCDRGFGPRCAKHAGMMRHIHHAYFEGGDKADSIIDRLCDGYGAGAGALDWSGVRDSSVAAVEAMYRALRQAGL